MIKVFTLIMQGHDTGVSPQCDRASGKNQRAQHNAGFIHKQQQTVHIHRAPRGPLAQRAPL